MLFKLMLVGILSIKFNVMHRFIIQEYIRCKQRFVLHGQSIFQC